MQSGTSFFITLLLIAQSLQTFSRENERVYPTGNGKKQSGSSAAQCQTPTAQTDLDVNNVRTTILAASDMWWDLVNPAYEIPKGSNKNSLYSGALWIGGLDVNGNIKVAGQTYRQNGNDFWTGPIDTINVTTTSDVCAAYDKHFVTTREDVIKFTNDPTSVSSSVAANIRNWPGNGNWMGLLQGKHLAPFFDKNGDEEYNADDGDYPYYNFSGDYPSYVPGYNKPLCNDYLFGDKNLWWVFNDVGNIHSETTSDPIGLEIRAQAFAFNTNDEINNMTFYKYQIINRSHEALNETYFGQWVDPDLGNAVDDYVGCDVFRGLGYVYNGDEEDETGGGYGFNPPACGVDFFQGPVADMGDGIDNDKDGCVDCSFIDSAGIVVSVPDYLIPELIIMSKFVYYNNINNHPQGNPSGATDFYSYLKGYWLNNTQITYGGDGTDPTKPVCNYMFPGTTDTALFNTEGEWTEVTAGNLAGDRRFLQSAGPFTLQPGAVNYVTTGVVWARANSGGALASVNLMKSADDKAQALFDNCFKLLDGPDAPDLVIRELKNQLIFTLENTDTSTIEQYNQQDPTIVGYPDSLTYFNFQGYKIYQLKDHLVTVSDLNNPDKARIVKQMDIKDGVTTLVNYTYDQNLGTNFPELKVSGADQGIDHSFSLTADAFASGNPTLVNNKSYYYMAVSYAYNQYKEYDPTDPNALDGQKKPYLEGRNNIKTYNAIPHATAPESGGSYLHANYGDGPQIQRIDGQGNGGLILDLTPESEAEIMNSPVYRSYHPVYRPGAGPVNVRVFDPTLVIKGDYETRFSGIAPDSVWRMSDLNTNTMVESTRPIRDPFDQLIPSWGLSANIHTVKEAGEAGAINNGLLAADMFFTDNSKQWLTGIPDGEGGTLLNWVRSGTNTTAPYDNDYAGLDDGEVYENVIGGIWAPYRLTSLAETGPKWNGPGIDAANKLSNLASIDIVFTADKTKWTRAAVVETDDLGIGIGQARKFDLRKSASVDKNGQPNFGGPDNNDFTTGMGWFPGYAINQETGERLNIAFGENSVFPTENGADMIWNPTASLVDQSGNVVFGGMHYIYVFGHNNDSPSDGPLYDGCAYIHEALDSAAGASLTIGNFLRRNVWKDAMWVNLPLTVASKITPLTGQMLIPPTDVRIRLRVAKNYKTYISKTIKTMTLQPNTKYRVVDGDITYNSQLISNGSDFTTDATTLTYTGNGSVVTPLPENNFMPLYRFNTDNLAPSKNNTEALHDALSMINVVPNPYYAFSGYEGTMGVTGQVDNRIRITNLPSVCKISIFTTNGTLIRQFDRNVAADNSRGGTNLDNPSTSQDWDLKNHKGITIAGGIYLIHIEVPGIGERVIKWFGVIRPVDLDTF